MYHYKTKPLKSKFQIPLYKQAEISVILELDFVDRKLISGILSCGTFEINHGQPCTIGKNATN